ncbi:hypothetical protein [Chitinophaga sp. S165]|uniref:hypothetical protein n=1 Tax=Chitinophaga sp. S165 TaxID=2135462 RepID=UPI0011B392D7|nr:hypothetical protein [Chitinophaga sp. S165]
MKARKIGFVMAMFAILSLTTVRVSAQDAKKKVAVVTFFVSKQIGLGDGNAQLASRVTDLADNPNFNLQPVLETFYSNFFNGFAKKFPFELMPEDYVIKNETYKAYDTSSSGIVVLMSGRELNPPGYKTIYPGGFLQKSENRNQNKLLEVFPESDGVMFVWMDYEFVPKKGFAGMGTCGMKATIHLTLYNKEAKKVFSISEYATSKKQVAMVGGIPVTSFDKVLPLCEDASQRLIGELEEKLDKITRKVDSKL